MDGYTCEKDQVRCLTVVTGSHCILHLKEENYLLASAQVTFFDVALFSTGSLLQWKVQNQRQTVQVHLGRE